MEESGCPRLPVTEKTTGSNPVGTANFECLAVGRGDAPRGREEKREQGYGVFPRCVFLVNHASSA